MEDDDKFDHVMKSTALAAITTFVPGSSILFEGFKAWTGDPSERFKRRVLEDLQDRVIELEQAVAALRESLRAEGKRITELDAAGVREVMEEFCSSIAGAVTPARRRALINVTTSLFDPRLGPLSFRHHWLQVVRALSDGQIETLQLIADGAIWLSDFEYVVVGTLDGVTKYGSPELSVQHGAARFETVGAANIAALRTILAELQRREPSLLQPATEHSVSPMRGNTFHLTPAGEMVLKLITGTSREAAAAESSVTNDLVQELAL